MACENVKERKCFTYLWKIENAIYYCQQLGEPIASPDFEVDEIEETKWKLEYLSDSELEIDEMGFHLIRLPDSRGTESVSLECQFALLALDGTVLSSGSRKQVEMCIYSAYDDVLPVKREDVFIKRRSEFPAHGTLMVQCRIWKRGSEFSEDVQWVARTRIGVEKRSFLWKVGNFRALEPQKKYTHEIKSLATREQSISLDLYLNAGINYFVITRKDPKIIFATFQMSIVDALGNATQCLKDELWFDWSNKSRQFSLGPSKAKLMEKNDILTLRCACDFFSGNILEEIERVISDSAVFEKSELENRYLDKEKVLPSPEKVLPSLEKVLPSLEKALPSLEKVLYDDLKSMLNERFQSDIKLKTSSKTYPAHKCILGARSPVFKAMFSSDMKEKINDCVEIEDLNDDTVSRMLQYIYSAEVEELEWGSAIQLYEASDKYEILTLKDVCSSYLKKRLCQNNACEALMIADMHRDEDLKGFVQDFIVRSCKDIVFSEEWEQLMETNLKLAAETMRLKFKE